MQRSRLTACLGVIFTFVFLSTAAFAVDSLYIDPSGKVGIGTTSPTQKLDVSGLLAVNGEAVIHTSADEIYFGDILSGDGLSALSLLAGDRTRMRITRDGRVGVGTTLPQTALHLDGSSPWLLVTGGAEGFLGLGSYSDSSHQSNIWFDSRGDLVFCSQPHAYKGTSDYQTIRLKVKGDTGYVLPGIDGSQNLGSSAFRWNTIYATNQMIQTSDERKKDQVKEIPLGLEFVKQLKPIAYKWKDYSVPEVKKSASQTVPKMQKVNKPIETREVVLVNGRYVEKKTAKLVAVDEPVFEQVPLFDEKGKLIGKHSIPVMETRPVETVEQQAKEYRFTKTHYGLSAQQVQAALSKFGTDFDGVVYEPETDSYGLRMGEFVPILIKAVQELSAEVSTLRAEVEKLKKK